MPSAPVTVRVGFRPLRIGWCVLPDDWVSLWAALELTHLLWGGRYNPIITAKDYDFAEELSSFFNVDALFPIGEEKQVRTFAEAFPHQRWTFGLALPHRRAVPGSPVGILDVSHPLRPLDRARGGGWAGLNFHPWQFTFDAFDPLRHAFAAQFGTYPAPGAGELDYAEQFRSVLGGPQNPLHMADSPPRGAHRLFTPNNLTTYGLRYDQPPAESIGCYVGQATRFDDLVHFWNLRAMGLDLSFYDPAFAARLNGLRDDQVERAERSGGASVRNGRHVEVWYDPASADPDADHFGGQAHIVIRKVDADLWRARLSRRSSALGFLDHRLRCVDPRIGPPRQVLGTVSAEAGQLPVLTFPLPDIPAVDPPDSPGQRLAFLFRVDGYHDDRFGFRAPNLPRLNTALEVRHGIAAAPIRVQPDGTAFLVRTGRNSVALRALDARQLIADVFSLAGVKSTPSQAGLVGARLIQQMGGLWGCSVFRVPGVRMLIEKYNPDQAFTRSGANQFIGGIGATTKRPQLGAYKYLNIGRYRSSELQPDHIFVYLAERGVFRPGLELRCPHCALKFWVSLENARTLTECEYCGRSFHIVEELGEFRYRRSGLFGRSDNQHGGIPVALTLLRFLDTIEHRWVAYATGTELSKAGVVPKCETDFVILSQDDGGRVSVVIGECKTRQEITDQDITNLSQAASALEAEGINVYVTFSKLAEFSDAEVERLRAADRFSSSPRLILFGPQELEPDYIYERVEETEAIDPGQSDLPDLAKVSRQVYLKTIDQGGYEG